MSYSNPLILILLSPQYFQLGTLFLRNTLLNAKKISMLSALQKLSGYPWRVLIKIVKKKKYLVKFIPLLHCFWKWWMTARNIVTKIHLILGWWQKSDIVWWYPHYARINRSKEGQCREIIIKVCINKKLLIVLTYKWCCFQNKDIYHKSKPKDLEMW